MKPIRLLSFTSYSCPFFPFYLFISLSYCSFYFLSLQKYLFYIVLEDLLAWINSHPSCKRISRVLVESRSRIDFLTGGDCPCFQSDSSEETKPSSLRFASEMLRSAQPQHQLCSCDSGLRIEDLCCTWYLRSELKEFSHLFDFTQDSNLSNSTCECRAPFHKDFHIHLYWCLDCKTNLVIEYFRWVPSRFSQVLGRLTLCLVDSESKGCWLH